MKEKIWDVIIAGGGPAGCNAALVLARVSRQVLLFDEGKQRNLRSHGLHNYLTRDGIAPADFLGHALDDVSRYHVNIVKARVEKARKLNDHLFRVEDALGGSHYCRRLLLATGVTDELPDLPGMRELWGAAVHHCPYCDGWECRDSTIGLYSRRYNGFGMARALLQLSKDIVLFTDGAYYLGRERKATLEKEGIRVVPTRVTGLAYKEQKLEGVHLAGGGFVSCSKLFVNHGHRVNNALLLQLGCRCIRTGAAVTNRRQQTSIPGVYAAGDASIDIHFAVVAAAEGAKAAVAIHNDLLALDADLRKH